MDQMATVQRNESASSFAWLWARLGEPSREPWGVVRGRMLGVTQAFGYMQDWVPDFWMARNSRAIGSAVLAPSWDPPELVDEWPTLGVEAVRGLLHARTNHSAFVRVMQENTAPVESDRREAVEAFLNTVTEAARVTWPALRHALEFGFIDDAKVWYPPGDGSRGDQDYDKSFEFFSHTTGLRLQGDRYRDLVVLPDAAESAVRQELDSASGEHGGARQQQGQRGQDQHGPGQRNGPPGPRPRPGTGGDGRGEGRRGR